MDASSLIMWAMGVVLIGIGVPLYFVGRYLAAPEEQKKRTARGLKIVAIVWMAAGVLIYVMVLVRAIITS